MNEFSRPTDENFNQEEELEYLNDLINSYGELVENIGNNGLSAPLILLYRSEIAETIELLGIDNLPAYALNELNMFDEKLRESVFEFVAEAGRSTFIEGRAEIGAHKDSWWWYLDTLVKERKKVDLWKEFKKWLRQ